MLQSATFTPFRTPLPDISLFDLFGLRPGNCEKCLTLIFLGVRFKVLVLMGGGGGRGGEGNMGNIIPCLKLARIILKT